MSQQIYTQFSERERQISRLLLQGLSNKLIARQLFICERTVKFHCSNIYKKSNVTNRMALVLRLNSLNKTITPTQ